MFFCVLVKNRTNNFQTTKDPRKTEQKQAWKDDEDKELKCSKLMTRQLVWQWALVVTGSWYSNQLE